MQKFKKVFLIFLLGCVGVLSSYVSVHAQTQPSKDVVKPVSGFYGPFQIAVSADHSKIWGTFREAWGFDANTKGPKFSCEFWLKGAFDSQAQKYKVSLQVQNTSQWQKGEMEFKLEPKHNQKSITLVLEEPLQNCAQGSFSFAKKAPSFFDLIQPTTWQGLAKVKADKAYFHLAPDHAALGKAYVVKNDVLYILEEKENWVKARYVLDRQSQNKVIKKLVTEGWIKRSDLE